MMLRRILTSIALGIAITGVHTLNASVAQAVVILTHNQTTLGEQLIFESATDTKTPSMGAPEFEIVNMTGIFWTDYHIRIELSMPEENNNDPTANNFADLTQVNFVSPMVFTDFSVMGSAMGSDQFSFAWLEGGPGVPNGGNFVVQLTINHNAPVRFYGTPSIPEPGTLALFGLGLAGLGFARRRKAV